jgi:hypothetical protein
LSASSACRSVRALRPQLILLCRIVDREGDDHRSRMRQHGAVVISKHARSHTAVGSDRDRRLELVRHTPNAYCSRERQIQLA